MVLRVCVCVCCSQVLAESDQLRKEADDLGPRAELDHWKKRMSRFNYLLDQLKSPDVKAVLGVLMMAKSKLIKVRRYSRQQLCEQHPHAFSELLANMHTHSSLHPSLFLYLSPRPSTAYFTPFLPPSQSLFQD